MCDLNSSHDLRSLKWKPPSENSIDFKLVLRFPPTSSRSPDPDLFAKPVFELHVYCGDEQRVPRYEFYDVMHVEDDEWERCYPTLPVHCARADMYSQHEEIR